MSSYSCLVASAIFIAALLGIGMASAQSESECTSAIVSLMPCLTFTSGSATQPSSTCCTSLAEVVKSEPQCLCSLVGGSGASQFNINETLALQLPKACNVETPPASQCNSAVADAPVPSAPTTSKATSSPQGESKASPPPDNSNAGSGVKMTLSFVLFIGFVASYASAILAI